MPKPAEYHLEEERIFVDRNKPQQQFIDAYNNSKEHADEYNILCYYGDGGIGKSELYSTLQNNLKENRSSSNSDSFIYPVSGKPIPYVSYDLGDSDVVQVLHGLRNKLNSKQNFRFPLFDLAYISYKTSHGDENDLITVDKLRDYIGSDSWIVKILDFGGAFNIFSSALSPLLTAIDKGKDLPEQFKEFSYKKRAKDIISIIRQNEDKPEELKKLLSTTFSMDLAWNCQNQIDKPLVVLLDTFEAHQKHLEDHSSEEDWLKNVIIHSVNTLYVLFGRNECHYKGVANIPLNNFDEVYTTELMGKKGITDKELIKKVYSITGGLPYYINICISNYNRLLKSNQLPTIDLIGATTNDMNQRYYKYLDDSEKQIVEIASLFDVFTYEDILNSSKAFFGPTFSEKKCQSVMTECIVKKVDEENWRVHEIAKIVFLVNAQKNMNSYYPNMLFAVIKTQIDYLENIDSDSSIPVIILNNCYKNIYELYNLRPVPPQIDMLPQYMKILAGYYKISEEEFKAENLLQTSVEIYKNKYGEEDPKTIASMCDLATFYNGYSPDEAILLQNEIVNIQKKTLGEMHPDTLQAMSTLADYYDYYDEENLVKSITLRKEIINNSKEAFGEEHLITLSYVNMLIAAYVVRYNRRIAIDATDTYKCLTEAIQFLENEVESRKISLGDKDRNTLYSISALALLYSYLGEKETLTKHLLLFEKYLDIWKESISQEDISSFVEPNDYIKRVLEQNWYDPFYLMINLVFCYSKLGDKDSLLRAISLLEESLNLPRKSLGGRTLQTYKADYTLAHSCEDDDDEERPFKSSNLKKYLRELQETDSNVVKYLILVHYLAICYYHLGDKDSLRKAISAREETFRTLGILPRLFQSVQIARADETANLANWYHELGDKDSLLEAIELFEHVIEWKKIYLDNDDDEILSILDQQAMCYRELGDKESLLKAIELQKKVLDAQNKVLGINHHDTLRSMNNLACAYSSIGDSESLLKAIQLLDETLKYEKNSLGDEDSLTLTSMNNLACFYKQVGGKDSLLKAITLQEKTVETQKRVLGKEHSNTLHSMKNLASFYCYKDDKESLLKAVELLNEVHETYIKVYGDTSEISQDIANKISRIYNHLSNQSK